MQFDLTICTVPCLTTSLVQSCLPEKCESAVVEVTRCMCMSHRDGGNWYVGQHSARNTTGQTATKWIGSEVTIQQPDLIQSLVSSASHLGRLGAPDVSPAPQTECYYVL